MTGLSAWELLDLETDASLAEIRTAYRRMALAVHPDTNPNDPFAAARFREVRAAYDTLLRERDGLRAAPTAPVRIACVLVGPHLVGTLPVHASGARRHRWLPLTLWAIRTCAFCEGDGAVMGEPRFPFGARRQDCSRCDGTGVVGVERRLRIRLPTLRAGTAIRLRDKGLGPGGHAFVHLR
jgi:DnaJ-class molecular chaperone